MAFSVTAILILLLSNFLSSTPVHGHDARWNRHDRDFCLTDNDATFLVNIMVSFSVSFNPAYAGNFLADDFTVQSDSINFLSGGLLQPGALTAPSKAAFLAATFNLTTSSPQPAISVLNIIHSCDEIAFRWRSEAKPLGPQGIDILVVREDGRGSWLIVADYSEFNNGADLVNAGVFPCK